VGKVKPERNMREEYRLYEVLREVLSENIDKKRKRIRGQVNSISAGGRGGQGCAMIKGTRSTSASWRTGITVSTEEYGGATGRYRRKNDFLREAREEKKGVESATTEKRRQFHSEGQARGGGDRKIGRGLRSALQDAIVKSKENLKRIEKKHQIRTNLNVNFFRIGKGKEKSPSGKAPEEEWRGLKLVTGKEDDHESERKLEGTELLATCQVWIQWGKESGAGLGDDKAKRATNKNGRKNLGGKKE